MLRVGLTGGIGSGKSTVAARLVERGAVLVDSDRLAREVVAAGTPGLAAVVEAFGTAVLAADGTLDRPALAAVVFDDPAARAKLNGIVHPLVRQRSAELIAAVPEGSIVVQDIPLLVEGGMAAQFPLVVVVHADAAVRVRRLVELRGMPEPDARARIAAQADDAARRAVADVWLDNSGTQAALTAAVDVLWDGRLAPFAAALDAARPAHAAPTVVDPDPEWAAQAARLVARVRAAAGSERVAHVGPTAVPGLRAADVVDLLLVTASPADTAALRAPLAEVGFVPGDEGGYASADPGRPALLQVHALESTVWRSTLLLRDWLRADTRARTGYAGDPVAQAAAAEAWAASSGWAPSLNGAKPDA